MIEYDLSDGKIYAYSAADYIDNLSSRTRDDTLKRYRDAIKNNEFMFFVKDTKRLRRLCSYIYPLPDLSEIISVKKS